MKEILNRKIVGVRFMLHEAEPKPEDERRCWVHRSTDEHGQPGKYEIRRWFSIETVDNMRWPLVRIILFRWLLSFYCTFMRENPTNPEP